MPPNWRFGPKMSQNFLSRPKNAIFGPKTLLIALILAKSSLNGHFWAGSSPPQTKILGTPLCFNCSIVFWVERGFFRGRKNCTLIVWFFAGWKEALFWGGKSAALVVDCLLRGKRLISGEEWGRKPGCRSRGGGPWKDRHKKRWGVRLTAYHLNKSGNDAYKWKFKLK